MSLPSGILARGPWAIEDIVATWDADHYDPPAHATDAADAAIAALAERGSPSHDGHAARMVDWTVTDAGRLELRLQPVRWALRLVEHDASESIASLCVIRDSSGRWLAGRRAAWLSSWAGRWALGAGGAVDLGESPADTLTRELDEEWSVAPERVRGEALVRLQQQMILFVGQAWLAPGVEDQVVPDSEHDAFAWWPAKIDDWPPEADAPLRYMAGLLDAADHQLLTRQHLKWASFAHSTIYLILLVAWIIPGLHPVEFVFGLAHGLGWFAMCGLMIAGLKARLVNTRLAVAVAVLGAVGPFIGTFEFVRQDRARALNHA